MCRIEAWPPPGDDLLDVLGPVEEVFDLGVAAFPVCHAQVASKWVIRGHVDHGLRDCHGGERVVRGRLEKRITARERIADDTDGRRDGDVSGEHVHGARTKGADVAQTAAVHSPRHPAFQVARADGVFREFAHELAIKQRRQRVVEVADCIPAEARSPYRELAGLLQMGVAGERELLAEGVQVVEHFLELERVLIAHQPGGRERQLPKVALEVGRGVAPFPAAAGKFHAAPLNEATADDQRNLEAHATPPQAYASCCPAGTRPRGRARPAHRRR